MKNMQPVASQDRPKMIAASVGIVIALGFVVRSLAGTSILAHSGAAPNAPVAAPVPSIASMPASPTAPGGEAPSGFRETAGEAAGFEGGERPRLHDPFRPLPVAGKTGVAIASAAAAPALPAPPLPAVPPAASKPARAEITEREVLPEPEASPDAPPHLASPESRPQTAAPLAPPAGEPVEKLRVDPTPPVTLVGTVGGDRSAVALFRVAGRTIVVRPAESVVGWRITRIRAGQAWLTRRGIRQTVRVGETLSDDSAPADDSAAPAR